MMAATRRAVVICGACALAALGCEEKRAEVEAPVSATAVVDEAEEPESDETGSAEAKEDPTVIASQLGPIRVTPMQHATLALSFGDKVIQIDPWGKAYEAARAAGREVAQADLVLVTDLHPDHLDPEAITQVRKEGAPVVVPQAVAEQAAEALPSPTILANGENQEFFEGAVSVRAVPMYNLERKNDQGELFHPKGRGNGYVLTIGEARIYVSGDTACTPDVKKIGPLDAAFLSMNLPYTMPVEEAAACADAFKPAALYPYHYRGQDVSRLEGLMQESDEVDVRLLDWYPGQDGSTE